MPSEGESVADKQIVKIIFFNHRIAQEEKKLFLDWIRNEISFIYRIVIKSLETVYQIKRTLKQ